MGWVFGITVEHTAWEAYIPFQSAWVLSNPGSAPEPQFLLMYTLEAAGDGLAARPLSPTQETEEPSSCPWPFQRRDLSGKGDLSVFFLPLKLNYVCVF